MHSCTRQPCSLSEHLLAQEDGSIALLDFGQCKALPVARHHALAELIVAMDDGDDVRIALAMSRFGMDFSALGGGLPNPAIIRIVAFIIFDTRCAGFFTAQFGSRMTQPGPS